MATIKECYAWIGPSNGYAALYWHRDSKPASDYDWIGLYSAQSHSQGNWLTWQWAAEGSYVSSEIIRDNLSVRFYRYEGSSYEEKMRTQDLQLETEVNAQGERTLQPGCYVTCSSGGYATLNWTEAKHVRDRDWVGLYADVHRTNGDYISKCWQWAKGYGSSYVTSQAFVPGLHARYITEVDSKYIALRRSKPIGTGYLDLTNIYELRGPRRELMEGGLMVGDRIINIMVDQLKKAVNQEPSIFSFGRWPFGGENLLFKNLSYEEVKVIGAELPVSKYYDVIMVYYDTYKMAIRIADDSERNAKRHAFWQISLVRKFGIDFARKLGDAHERGRPGTEEDNRVDEANNRVAITYAQEHPHVNPVDAADQMWVNGLLEGYKPSIAPEHTKDEL